LSVLLLWVCLPWLLHFLLLPHFSVFRVIHCLCDAVYKRRETLLYPKRCKIASKIITVENKVILVMPLKFHWPVNWRDLRWVILTRYLFLPEFL
jgi:hypothetical protein